MNEAQVQLDGTGTLTIAGATLSVSAENVDAAMAAIVRLAQDEAKRVGEPIEFVTRSHSGALGPRLRVTPEGWVLGGHANSASAAPALPELATEEPVDVAEGEVSEPRQAAVAAVAPVDLLEHGEVLEEVVPAPVDAVDQPEAVAGAQRPRPRSRGPIMLAGAAGTIVLLVATVGALATGGTETSARPTPEPSSTLSVAPAVTLSPVPRTVQAKATAKPGEAVRFEISSTRPPVDATVRVRTLAGKVLATRKVQIAANGTGHLAITGLTPGTYLWEVRVDDATPVAGRVAVPKAPVRPVSAYTPPPTSTSSSSTSTTTKPSSGGGGGGNGGPVGVNDGGGATGPVGAN